ncbi:aminoglycoside phosphotransferase (plasmid) [Rhodococcus sp. BH4]|uniref:phosphotransferase family protein n=1 Tax=Rhodococcus sp. BH4 TaxID=1807790 RepID=UPI0009C3D833|nr:phosphotransferase family protein [Rhodococcus sp. BH4]ARE37876.1 aminoglycoside phosphotransferase [Rhodococcus sp. BH4]
MQQTEHETLVRELASRTAVAAEKWRAGTTVTDVRALTGGASSLTFIAELEHGGLSESVVLKVAPPGLAPLRNRDVIRQGRVMNALQGKFGVKAPIVRFDDSGDPPNVPPFVAMEVVPGECVEPLLEAERVRDAESRRQTRARFLSAARMLGHLHRVNPCDVGLGDEPVMELSGEIDRWTRAFETLPDDLRGDFQACAQALHETMPVALPPVVNHGDYRLGNTLCEGDAVTAIIDWEIWSVGDPRVDLTWLTYFTDEAKHPAAAGTGPCGAPTVAEVVREYEQALGRSVPDIDWFNALTRYKEAAATGLLIKRARKGGIVNSSFTLMEPELPNLLSEAMSLIGR